MSRASLMMTSNKRSPSTTTVSPSINYGFPDIPAARAPHPNAVAAALVADVSEAFCDMAIDAAVPAASVKDSAIDIMVMNSENGASSYHQSSSKPNAGDDLTVLDAPDLVTISMETEVPIISSNSSSTTQLTKQLPLGISRGEIPSSGNIGKETIRDGSINARDQFQPCSSSIGTSSSNGNGGLLCCCSGLAAARRLLTISSPAVSPVDDVDGYWHNDPERHQDSKQPPSEPI